MGNDNRGLTELAVTPLITRAVAVLRAAVPSRLVRAGAIGIDVGIDESGLTRGGDIEWAESARHAPTTRLPLTDAQKAAAWTLVGGAAFYQELWREAAGLRGDADSMSSPMYRGLSGQFNRNVRRALSINVNSYVCNDYLSGHVTVYLWPPHQALLAPSARRPGVIGRQSPQFLNIGPRIEVTAPSLLKVVP